MTYTKIGLCFSGGSVSGIAAHTGFGLALQDLHMWSSIGAMIGNSAGAMYAVPIAAGITPSQMYDFVSRLKINHVADLDMGGMAKRFFIGFRGWTGLTESNKLLEYARDSVEKYVGIRNPS